MGLEGLTLWLSKAYHAMANEAKRDKAYVAAAGAYVTARFFDGYTTSMAYHLFEEVGEGNVFIDTLVTHLSNPEGLIIGMGTTTIAALALTKLLNEGFSWTRHWGTVALLAMSILAGSAAVTNYVLYEQSRPRYENTPQALVAKGE